MAKYKDIRFSIYVNKPLLRKVRFEIGDDEVYTYLPSLSGYKSLRPDKAAKIITSLAEKIATYERKFGGVELSYNRVANVDGSNVVSASLRNDNLSCVIKHHVSWRREEGFDDDPFFPPRISLSLKFKSNKSRDLEEYTGLAALLQSPDIKELLPAAG
ncbi:MAG: hypothetical protein V1839_03580 [archaeon]